MKQKWNVPGTGRKTITEDGLRWEIGVGGGISVAFHAQDGEDAARKAAQVLAEFEVASARKRV